MREILFRGKRVIDGKWIESCCPLGEMHYGTVTYDFESKTVCQYTGLTDKNGRKIFEGDILKIPEKKNNNVKFEYGQFCVGINCPIAYIRTECEVIGNIFDNPVTPFVGVWIEIKCAQTSGKSDSRHSLRGSVD